MSDEAIKKFSVVLFTCDSSVCAVPSSWLFENNSKCYWPVKGVNKLLKDAESIPGDDWLTFDIELKKSYDKFERAAAKATKYLQESDLDTSEADTGRTRKQKRPVPEPSLVVNPPRGTITDSAIEKEDDPTPTTSTSNSSNSVTVADQGGINTTPANDLVGCALPTYIESTICLPTQEDVEALRNEVRELQHDLVRRLEEMKQEFADIKRLMITIINSSGQNFQLPRVIQLLPVRSKQAFDDLLKELENGQSLIELTNYLTKVGGDNLNKNVYNVLLAIFSKSFAKEVRLSSKSGKIAVENTKILKAVRGNISMFWGFCADAIHETWKGTLATTDSKINSIVGGWFRQQLHNGSEGSTEDQISNAAVNTQQPNTESSQAISVPNPSSSSA